MEMFTRSDVLAYMRLHRLVVVATLGEAGEPQAALVGVGCTDDLHVVFDTVTTSRKHANLLRDKRIAITFSGPDEKTLQLEGVASPVSVSDGRDAGYREAYYAVWPECREHLTWPDLAYWRVVPHWARYSDYDRGPLIREFNF